MQVSKLTVSLGKIASRSQVAFAVSIAFETLPMMAANPKFKMAEFAREVEKQSDFQIAERTVRNAGTLATALQLKYAEKIGSYVAGHCLDAVTDFTNVISEQAKAAGYVLTLEDVKAFCKGEKSAKALREEAKQAQEAASQALEKAKQTALEAEKTKAEADAEQAKAKQAEAEKLAEKAEQEKAEAEAKAQEAEAAKAEQAKRAEAIQAEAAKAQEAAKQAEQAKAEAEAKAEEARKVAESFAVRVGVNADGTPDIVVALNPNADFLLAVSKELAKMAKAIKAKQLQAA